MSPVAAGHPFTQPPPALTQTKQGAFTTKGQSLSLPTPESTITALMEGCPWSYTPGKAIVLSVTEV